MATVRVGNGWVNPQKATFTYYNPQTGQLVTQALDEQALLRAAGGKVGFMSPQEKAAVLQNAVNNGSLGDISQYIAKTDSNYLGGRSNVNISTQYGKAFEAISQQYPQMTKEQIAQYTNKWMEDRIAAGWDANEIENMMKDVTRNPNSVNQDFIQGVTGMIAKDEYDALGANATGASLAPDPRQSIQDDLRDFAGRMMQTVGADSPQAQRIAELAAAAGNKYATSSGMGPGGMTTQGVAGTAARAHTDLQSQREGLGLQALAAAGNQQLSVDQLNTQLQAQNQQAGVLNASGIGGLIGSGLGLVGGAVAAGYSGGAMAPAIPGLMAAGGAGGQAVGGLIQNTNSPPIQYGGAGGQRQSNYGGRNWGGTS